MARRFGNFRAAVGAAGVAMLLAACGGGDGTASGAGASDTEVLSAAMTSKPAVAIAADVPRAEKTFPAQLLDALNAARAQPRTCGDTPYAAAGPLSWHPQAEQAALVQAQYLQQNNLFTHTGANGSTIGDRMTTAGYAWRSVGENLAAGYADFGSVIQGWIDSPGHCANLMNAVFVDVGVVLVQGTSSNTYRTYWTMALGRPL